MDHHMPWSYNALFSGQLLAIVCEHVLYLWNNTIADLGSSTVADSISLEVLDQLQNTSEPCALSEAGGQESSAANNIYPDLSAMKM